MADINFGAITEALNNKVDLPTPSTPQDAVDYVVEVQRPTEANGYTWYRKYKSGWVEQGGLQSATTHGTNVSQVTLPVEMKDTNYTVVGAKDQSDSGSVGLNLPVSKTTTYFTWSVAYNSDQTRTLNWQVSGYAA